VAALWRREADATKQSRRVPLQGRCSEAARGHAEVKDGMTGVIYTADGKPERGLVNFEADGAHQTENVLCCFGIGVVASFALFLEIGISSFRCPALVCIVRYSRFWSRKGGET